MRVVLLYNCKERGDFVGVLLSFARSIIESEARTGDRPEETHLPGARSIESSVLFILRGI
jgi:hypothetical protein